MWCVSRVTIHGDTFDRAYYNTLEKARKGIEKMIKWYMSGNRNDNIRAIFIMDPFGKEEEVFEWNLEGDEDC